MRKGQLFIPLILRLQSSSGSVKFCSSVSKPLTSTSKVRNSELSEFPNKYGVVPQNKKRGRETKRLQFLDFKQLTVAGGKGGDGCLSFLRLFRNEFAGPDGGDGGNGGHIVFQTSLSTRDLSHVKASYSGNPGGDGMKKHCSGRAGEHTIVNVPNGTLIKDMDGKLIQDLSAAGQIFIAAHGGSGGHGNAFYVSSTNTMPMHYELGAHGEAKRLQLEMKVIAHCGLVGFPNAGKSTLLRALSRARPKVAAYPFTTLRPHVGIIEYNDATQISIADIPGLIPDAHKNRGLGFSFLRHIERCIFLIYIIDLLDADPAYQFKHLRKELSLYNPVVAQKPFFVIGNKVDLDKAKNGLLAWENNVGEDIIPVSAKKRENIEPLFRVIREFYDDHVNV